MSAGGDTGESELEEQLYALRRGELPEGARRIKENPARSVVQLGERVVKLLRKRPHKAAREARVLSEARARGIPVPDLLGSGRDWLATRFAPGRPAERTDLETILPAVRELHERGMLHGDLHLGNLWMTPAGPLFLDVQKGRFPGYVPGWLRRRELGYLAFSLGDPLPPALAHTAFWRRLRAQRHWRSRTRRALCESSGFTEFAHLGQRGWRRREVPEEQVLDALRTLPDAPPLKQGPGGRLARSGRWIGKQHSSARRARAAWLAGHGLEVRGIATGRAVALWQRWLVMEDVGPTLDHWVAQEFQSAPELEREHALESLAALLARLHAAGIYHGDLKANNIAWQPGRPPRLLDYGRVHFGWRVSRRRRIKNLAQLNAALADPVPGPWRERALQHYLRALGGPAPDPPLRERVIRESLRRRHLWSGC